MKSLQIPLRDVDERTIYFECANSFSDKTALNYIEDAVSGAENYESFVPQNIESFPKCEIREGDDKKIIKVYTEKFAKTGSVGKKYYEAIMTNAGGSCPICGDGKLKNLDHFLPKSLYPILCVTPANLIPICRDCNFDKGTCFDADYFSIPFNPYFDFMEYAWLKCDIKFLEDGTFEISYRNGFDKAVDEKKWRKYETHLKVFDLGTTFAAKAIEEIDNCKYYYQRMLTLCDQESVLEALKEKKESCEKNDSNSWRSALYRELVENCNLFCKWLKMEKPV